MTIITDITTKAYAFRLSGKKPCGSIKGTPAMAMGVTQEALTWRLLFLAPIRVTH